jgi:bacteriocin biosynthesis cyclodehydratase domain-containing protein
VTADRPVLTSKIPPGGPDVLSAAAELADGAHSWAEIWGKLLCAGHAPVEIGLAVKALEDLCEGQGPDRQDLTPALSRQAELLASVSAQEGLVSDSDVPVAVGRRLQASLAAADVLIFDDNAESGSDLPAQFNRVGISKARFASPPGPNHVVDCDIHAHLVVCATHGRRSRFAGDINRIALASKLPAIYYHVHGLHAEIGPLVIPGQTACYQCCSLRRDAALAGWERAVLQSVDDGGQLGCALGSDWLLVDAIKFLAGIGEPISRGRVLFIDYYAGVPEVHTLLRVPRCPECGAPARPSVELWDQRADARA